MSAPVDVDQAVEVARARQHAPLPNIAEMSMAELQTYSVQMQTEFVEASLAYETAKTEFEQAREDAEDAQAASEEAAIEVAESRDQLADMVVTSHGQGLTADPSLAMFGGPQSLAEWRDAYATFGQITTIQTAAIADLTVAQERADRLAERASALRVEAADAEADAEFLLDDIQGRASKVAAAANLALSGSSGEALFASAEQEARNQAALKNWRAYLRLLERARVVPPSAEQLLDPTDPPAGLEPLVDATGAPVPGVAARKFKGQTVTVLSRETIGAVSRAFAAIGKPYVDGLRGPETYDCSGLVAAAWAPEGVRLPSHEPVAQFRNTRKVDVRNAQVGDLVFFTDRTGVQHVGLNLGGRLMLTADASSMQVGVQHFPKNLFAITRATLDTKRTNRAPRTDTGSWTRCGGTSLVTSGAGMVYPIEKGRYTFSAWFGQAGPMWSSGYHTGLDFSAAAGTPVVAAKGGSVTVEPSGWAGPHHVIIDHGDGLQTTYAHMRHATVKTGDVVQPGQLIGAVGSEGNSTGPHLHFEVIVSGVKVDPMLFLSTGGSGSLGWGGFTNGMIPESSTCPLDGTQGHRLRCDAAVAWNAMARAYQRHFDAPLCITDSYRSYAAQVTLYATKPSLAAVPGTSNHGWALAVDLCGGINSFGTPQFTWMTKHAPKFGWVHPDWARQGGGREEPWHWEFGSIS